MLLWVDREAGHGQGKPLNLRLRDVVDQRLFVMWQLGSVAVKGLRPYSGQGAEGRGEEKEEKAKDGERQLVPDLCPLPSCPLP